ncbi:MAG: hypothetical protein ABL912_01865 [Novosphingobium sp.]
MGSLVHVISSLTDARYGVNILEVSPPAGVAGAGTNVVAVVGNFPWGPVDAVTTITSPAELYDTLCPNAFGAIDSFPAMKAFLNKTFPSLVKVVRISPSGQATATAVFNDGGGSPAPSVDVSAKYAGSLGNSIKVAWAVNADDATARDATVTIGTLYSVTYKSVATIVASALVVTDPGDPYVTFAKHSAATLVPAAVAATSLASGADGTAVSGDYTGAMDLFADASVAFDVGFVAEPESGVIAAVNVAMKTFQDTYQKGIWVASTPASQSASAAKTAVALTRSDRVVYPWPRVKTINAYDPNQAEITVDGAAFAAVAIASVDPEVSPGGAPGAPALRGIVGVEQGASLLSLKDLNDNGVSPFMMSDALEGAILHNCLTTTLVAGKTRVFRRRMTDYITKSIAAFLERFVGNPLDINISTRTLGPITGPEIATVRQFLSDLKVANRIVDYSIDEFSANLASNIADGTWIILGAVRLVSAQEAIVFQAQIGEAVEIAAA